MRVRGVLVLAAVPGLLIAPKAVAEPEFPDLDGYTTVDEKQYATYGGYRVSGVQFVTPGGIRCRMHWVMGPPVDVAECWGPLPGTPDGANHVSVDAHMRPPSAFGHIDLGQLEFVFGGPYGLDRLPIDPSRYAPIAQGQKIAFRRMECAVGAGGLVACRAASSPEGEWHGFVLSPDGSWTF